MADYANMQKSAINNFSFEQEYVNVFILFIKCSELLLSGFLMNVPSNNEIFITIQHNHFF